VNGAPERSILLVDDNADDTELMLYAFKEINFPFKVATARDGQEAVDYLFCRGRFTGRDRGDAPLLVVLDLKMPRMGGIEVLSRMREDRWFKYLPVMVLTSSEEERDKAEALRLGISLYLCKPVLIEQFMAVARRVESLVSSLTSPA
jgi:two-component system response regulator